MSLYYFCRGNQVDRGFPFQNRVVDSVGFLEEPLFQGVFSPFRSLNDN